MKVFVSSTVYDLVDIRSELEQMLREMDITPVMSDHKLSDFTVAQDANSIETCLLNVESSDAVIVVLDQRYGPKLGSCGFDDISATHLEYRHARKHEKPIYFYVRERLEADFNIHRKNQDKDLKLSWVTEKKDLGLFDFLKEHRELDAKSKENNWYSLFSNSVDLKAAIRRHIEPVIKPQTLLKAIQENRFPIFECDHEVKEIQGYGVFGITCRITLKNIGLAPAFDLKSQFPNEDSPSLTKIVAPGEVYKRSIISTKADMHIDAEFAIEYRSSIGIMVRECYHVGSYIDKQTILWSGVTLKKRTYHNAPPPLMEILDEIPEEERL